MSYNHLAETTVKLIIAHLKANLPTELANVRTTIADPVVNTDPPLNNSYFIYPKAMGLQAPCIFVIAESQEFRARDVGANHINSLVNVNVAVLVEDTDLERLTIKAYRYQSALHRVLVQATLTSADSQVKLVIIPMRSRFTPEYTNAQREGDDQGVFRKEVHFECEVEHYENY